MKASFAVTGIRELEAAMADLSKSIRHAVLGRAVKKAAEPIERLAKMYAPRVTGKLRESIGTVVIRSSAGKSAFAAAMRAGASRAEAGAAAHAANIADAGASRVAKARVQATAPHAHFVEFGTIDQPAQPFMRPAVDAEKGRALSSIKIELKKEIEKTARRAAARRKRK